MRKKKLKLFSTINVNPSSRTFLIDFAFSGWQIGSRVSGAAGETDPRLNPRPVLSSFLMLDTSAIQQVKRRR